jgi:hypothetical protein
MIALAGGSGHADGSRPGGARHWFGLQLLLDGARRDRAYIKRMSRPTTLERAFALAHSGRYLSVSEIRSQLRSEGYDISQLSGPSLQKQLRELCAGARKAADSS